MVIERIFMTIFRTIFCGVLCALVSLPAFGACGPYLASNIANYKSGDVSKWLKYDCVSDNAKWQISGTPLEWAIRGSGVCPGNYNAVKAILEKQPDLANTPTYDKKGTMLSVSIGNCCDADNEKKCGANPQDKIAKLLIDNGADVNIVTELSPGNAPRRKRTLLDLVRAQQQYTDTCKRNAGKNTCPAIEQLLIDAGAKTYAELNGETTSSIQAVVHQDTPEIINTTASVPPATKSRTVEISGTILDSETDEPVPYANIVLVNPDGSMISNAGCQTDSAGKFSGKFNNVPKNAMMRVSFVGYQTLTLSPSSNAQIKLQPTANALKEVSIVATICDDEMLKKLNAREGEKAVDANGKTFCKPTKCVNDLYELRDGVCVKDDEVSGTKYKIEYDYNGGTDNPAGTILQTEYVAGEGLNVKSAPLVREGYVFVGWCMEGKENECSKNVKISKTDTGDKKFIAKWESVDSNVVSGDDSDDTETAAPNVDNVKEIAEAESAYSNAKANEQSLANRMLGGATMAATGIGGMQLAQGLAEQNADKKAEQDMTAYLATFQCKVGDNGGRSYSGGEMGIEVAGTNQLTGLYQQYVDLAASLKERKTALGMAPGIESQVIMDKANMGLYDAEGGKGIENGTYASLYRASRGNETDANKLADQQNTSATRVKAGAIAAGVGAIGGAIGNSAINGKIADLIKDAKTQNANNKDNKAAIEEFKKGLTSAGFKNVNKLDFSSLDISGLKGKLSGVDWSGLTNKFAGQDVTQVLNTTNASSFSSSLTGLLGQ